LPINARLLHRPVSGREWIWGGLLTAAVVVFIVVGNPGAGHSRALPHTWTAVALVFGPMLIGCMVAARIWGGVRAAVLLAFVSGSFWGIFAVLTKEVVHLLGDGWAVTRTPELYAWLLVAAAGFAWGQSAFGKGPLTASMPILQVSQPVVAALLGFVVLGETLNTGRGAVIVLTVTVITMVAAVYALSRIDAVPAPFRDQEKRREVSRPSAGVGHRAALPGDQCVTRRPG
jgi:hypothetical protein